MCSLNSQTENFQGGGFENIFLGLRRDVCVRAGERGSYMCATHTLQLERSDHVSRQLLKNDVDQKVVIQKSDQNYQC